MKHLTIYKVTVTDEGYKTDMSFRVAADSFANACSKALETRRLDALSMVAQSREELSKLPTSKVGAAATAHDHQRLTENVERWTRAAETVSMVSCTDTGKEICV